MMVSSPSRVIPKDKTISNPLVLQEIDKDIVEANLSGKQEVPKEIFKMDDKELRERVHALEERVRLLAKLTIKVTHAAATTLHLLKDNHKGYLTHEDS